MSDEELFYQLDDPILTHFKQSYLNNRQEYLRNIQKSKLTQQQLELYSSGIQNIQYDCTLFTHKKSQTVLIGLIRKAVQIEMETSEKDEFGDDGHECNKKMGGLRIDHKIIGAIRDFSKIYLLQLIEQIFENKHHEGSSNIQGPQIGKYDVMKAQYSLKQKKARW